MQIGTSYTPVVKVDSAQAAILRRAGVIAREKGIGHGEAWCLAHREAGAATAAPGLGPPPDWMRSPATLLREPSAAPHAVAAWCAVRAAMAYDLAAAEHAVAREGGTGFTAFVAGDQAGFGYCREGRAILAFRGTVTLADWIEDARCWPTAEGLPRHRGFERCWRRLAPRVLAWVEALPEAERGLLLTGHSLGGAMAVLAAHQLATAGLPGLTILAVCLIGCPRVGLEAFTEAYERAPAGPTADAPGLGMVTRRYIVRSDLFARLPPPLGYRHVGRCFRLDPAMLLAAESGTATARLWEFLRDPLASLTPPLGSLARKPLPTSIHGGVLGPPAPPEPLHPVMLQVLLAMPVMVALSLLGLTLAALFAADGLSHLKQAYLERFAGLYPLATMAETSPGAGLRMALARVRAAGGELKG